MRKRLALLYGVLAGIVGLSLFIAIGHGSLWPDEPFEYRTVHTALDAWSTVFSLLMSIFLWQRWGRRGALRDYMLAAGFFWICVMDACTAVVTTNAEIEIFHGFSALGGSLWFALVWLPSRGRLPFGRHAPWMVVVLAGLLGIGLLVLGRLDGSIQGWSVVPPTLHVTNHVAGVLFLLAGARFVVDHHRRGGVEAFLLACLSTLLGMAAFSELKTTAQIRMASDSPDRSVGAGVPSGPACFQHPHLNAYSTQ